MDVVCMLWRRPDREPASLKKHYGGDEVRTLRTMLDRWSGGTAHLTCVTNLPQEASAAHSVVLLPDEVAVLPSQYPKLWLFSREFAGMFGSGRRFLFTDLDVVLLGDPRRLLEGQDAAPVLFRANYLRPEDAPPARWKMFPRRADLEGRRTPPFSTSLFLMRAGARPDVWERFTPARARRIVGWTGTDQKWVNWSLGRNAPTWPFDERFVGIRDLLATGVRPGDGAVILTCTHSMTPWDPAVRERLPWLAELYPRE